ncbi:MAG TPA: PIN domain-containing protein [Caulobacteraceae bacterium]|nr:PIN domain-containing protein [Caulobacteraceae bacterium]
MLKICLDLNVWCGAFLSRRLGRNDTATIALVDAVRSGHSPRGPVALIVSWGMLERLRIVLTRNLGFADRDAVRLVELIAGYAKEGPSLTLGGVGVIPIYDVEDRHVLETAWAGEADILATANLADFIQPGDQAIIEGRVYQLNRGGKAMLLAHPFEAIRWLNERA